jgi:hypothetical protein
MKTLAIVILSLAALVNLYDSTEETREQVSGRAAQIESVVNGAQ